ncbi:MAG: class I SAM-dependent methyltransferase [Bacteroidota bacterium]
MSRDPAAQYFATLVDFFLPLQRQGPGDPELIHQLLNRLPPLPDNPTIADLGCGTGAGTLELAKHFEVPIKAVDLSEKFINKLAKRAREAGLDHLVEPFCAEMGSLDWPNGSIDLLWSEGAAYILGFEEALQRWRPLLADGGIAVISEMTWFTPPEEISGELREFWTEAYPSMGTEQQNRKRAEQAGYTVLFTERLPAESWWTHFYNPLKERIQTLEDSATGMMKEIIEDSKREMKLFDHNSEHYGYTFYVLQTAS